MKKINWNISIHAPRVGGDEVIVNHARVHLISIHAPRVGGDWNLSTSRIRASQFQSTPPVWGATFNSRNILFRRNISIHAPRVGGDGDR